MKIVIICLSFISSLSLSAQTQLGQVKTLGRPNQPGKPLQDVTIRVQGLHNAVVSTAEGRFSFALQGKKEGDSYQLLSVQKNGYELNEQGMVGRSIAFSSRVPLTLVMVSLQQLQADKQRIENNSYAVAERNYKQQFELLEQQKSTNLLEVEDYRQKMQELRQNYSRYQSLIENLAEHYAHVDYDQLDEKEREVNRCIENGELERADSLLHSMFDPMGVLKRNQDLLEQIKRQQTDAETLMSQAKADLERVLKQQEKDAEHLYQLYTIALSRFDIDKARFYMETRAALDSTNVEWQNATGLFLVRNVGEHEKALSYYQTALRHALSQYSENSIVVAETYNNIGGCYYRQGEYKKALEYFEKARDTWGKTVGTEYADYAMSIDNIGGINLRQGDFKTALTLSKDALAIRERVLGKEDFFTGLSYVNIGTIYASMGDFQKSLEYLDIAVEIWNAFIDTKASDVSTLYTTMGTIGSYLGNQDKALYYHQKALDIRKRVLDAKHPLIADSYNNIGAVLSNQGKDKQSLDYYQEALNIYQSVLKPEHTSIGELYNNIGCNYIRLKQYENAMEYLLKAKYIREKAYGTIHHLTANSYSNLGFIYEEQGNVSLALESYQKAVEILEKTLGVSHPNTQNARNVLEQLKQTMKKD